MYSDINDLIFIITVMLVAADICLTRKWHKTLNSYNDGGFIRFTGRLRAELMVLRLVRASKG